METNIKTCSTGPFIERCRVVSPHPFRHLVGTVEHAHQSLLVIDAGEHQDNGGVGGDQIQVVLGEVKVDDLQSNVGVVSGSKVMHQYYQ